MSTTAAHATQCAPPALDGGLNLGACRWECARGETMHSADLIPIPSSRWPNGAWRARAARACRPCGARAREMHGDSYTCVFLCIYTYIYVYTRVYIYMHTCLHSHEDIYLSICVFIHLCSAIYICVCMCISICVCESTRAARRP